MTCHERLSGDIFIVQIDDVRAASGAVGELCDLGRDLAKTGTKTLIVRWPAAVKCGYAALAGIVEVQAQLGALLSVNWVGLSPDLLGMRRAFGFDGLFMMQPADAAHPVQWMIAGPNPDQILLDGGPDTLVPSALSNATPRPVGASSASGNVMPNAQPQSSPLWPKGWPQRISEAFPT